MHCCKQQHINGVSTCDSYSVSQTKFSVDVAVQVDDLRSIEKVKLSVDVAVQVDDLRSIEKAKLSVDVAVQVDDLRSIEKLSQHNSGRLAEGNYSLVLLFLFIVYFLIVSIAYCF